MPRRPATSRIRCISQPTPGVVDRDDRFRARGETRLDERLVEIERVASYVDEDRPRAAKHEGVDGGDERECGHDDFVARFNVEKQCRHLQCVGTRGRQQDVGDAEAHVRAARCIARERPVPCGPATLDGLPEVLDLLALQADSIERGCGWKKSRSPRLLADCVRDRTHGLADDAGRPTHTAVGARVPNTRRMMPKPKSCAPEKMAITEARKGKPGKL